MTKYMIAVLILLCGCTPGLYVAPPPPSMALPDVGLLNVKCPECGYTGYKTGQVRLNDSFRWMQEYKCLRGHVFWSSER